jgi:hypothetical protein
MIREEPRQAVHCGLRAAALRRRTLGAEARQLAALDPAVARAELELVAQRRFVDDLRQPRVQRHAALRGADAACTATIADQQNERAKNIAPHVRSRPVQGAV